MNFRKVICKLLGWIKFVYHAADCVRYEPPTPPPPPEWVEVKICLKCGLLASPKCAVSEVAWRKFLKGTEPTEVCDPSKCCQAREDVL